MQNSRKAKVQRQKNAILGLMFILVVVVIGFLLQYNPYRSSSNEINESLFSIKDAAASLSQIEFNNDKQNIRIEKLDSGWYVNDTYKLDPAMKQVLFSVLEQVQVQRVISEKSTENYVKQLQDTGVRVRLSASGEVKQEFYAGGTIKEPVSYFTDGNKAYQVHLPGYQNYVSGIFEVGILDWRERTIFNAGWQDIEKIVLQYPTGETLTLAYDNGLLKAENTNNASQEKINNYAEQLNYFYVDQFLPQDFIAVQQIEDFNRAGKLKIEALNPKYNVEMQFFKNPNFNAILTLINGQEYAGIRKDRHQKLFPELEYFTEDLSGK